MTKDHFIDDSVETLEGHIIVRGKRRFQYALPDDLKSLSFFKPQ
jgi:hypothetical protein